MKTSISVCDYSEVYSNDLQFQQRALSEEHHHRGNSAKTSGELAALLSNTLVGSAIHKRQTDSLGL